MQKPKTKTLVYQNEDIIMSDDNRHGDGIEDGELIVSDYGVDNSPNAMPMKSRIRLLWRSEN